MIYKFNIGFFIIEITENECNSYKEFEGFIEIM